jgi:hypothetical protein
MTYKVPDNVIDGKLYLRIKRKIEKDLKQQGRRWSLYASGRLVQQYKKQGGKYKGKKNDDGINRWFKEEWVDTCKLPKKVQCGRTNVPKSYTAMKRSFPYCRPMNRISKDAPKTVKEYSRSQLKKLCKKKRKSPKKTLR